jgi:hypothetical protein
MLILLVVSGYAVLSATILVLYHRHTKTKEALFVARRETTRAQARQLAAKKAAQGAEERCMAALNQVETALAQTGQALEVAGHIKLVSQQIHGLIGYIAASEEEAPQPLQRRPGRHALPASEGQPGFTEDAPVPEVIP